MKTLGKAVRERRMALGLTQREFASRVRFEDGHSIRQRICVSSSAASTSHAVTS